jgi:hypothetical protein
MIFLDSRYQSTPVKFILDGRSGETRQTVMRSSLIPTGAYKLYVWRDGMRLDYLASRLLGKPSLWWNIMDQNNDIIDPMSLDNGTVFYLP